MRIARRNTQYQTMDKVFLNNGLVDADKALIPAADSGLLYGAGLFETMQCCNGVVFSLDNHLDRLFSSAKALSINLTYDRDFITEAIYQTLKANVLTEARIRLTVTSGAVSGTEQPKSTLLITAAKFQPYPAEYYAKGILAVLSPYRQNNFDPLCGHKTLNYYSRILVLDFARKAHATEALWFTTDNRLAEGCISNVFLVKDSILYTPPVETPVLAGVARKAVRELAMKISLDFVEKDLYINDCLEADEVFLTNVIMQIMPVTQIEKHSVSSGQPGPVTKRIQKLFDELVKEKCGQKQ